MFEFSRRREAAMALFAALALVSVAALSARDAHAANAAVNINNFAFAPGSVSVSVGDTVTWTNSQSGTPHTATSDTAGAFNSGTISPGASFGQVFTAAGTFTYHCNFHSNMTGTIVVTGAAQAPTATPTRPAATNTPPPPPPPPTQPTATPEASATTAPANTAAPNRSPSASPSASVSPSPSITPSVPSSGSEDDDGGDSNALPILVGVGAGALVLIGGAAAYMAMRRRGAM